MAVDRKARRLYAQLIRRFLANEITNREYEDGVPDTHEDDQGIWQIYDELWAFYDDIGTHKLEGKHALDQEGRELFERCILFLESDLEYEWPKRNPLGCISNLLWVIPDTLTWGRLGNWRENRLKKKMERMEGDHEVWPFFRKEDFEKFRSY